MSGINFNYCPECGVQAGEPHKPECNLTCCCECGKPLCLDFDTEELEAMAQALDQGLGGGQTSPFFEDVQAFRTALSQPATGNGCWSCGRTGLPLIGFNVHKDLNVLDIPTTGCEQMISVCPHCAAAYMNSFNTVLYARDGDTCPEKPWTAESILRSMMGQG